MTTDHVRTCRRCGYVVPADASGTRVPIHPGLHGVACPGSGTRPLVLRSTANAA